MLLNNAFELASLAKLVYKNVKTPEKILSLSALLLDSTQFTVKYINTAAVPSS